MYIVISRRNLKYFSLRILCVYLCLNHFFKFGPCPYIKTNVSPDGNNFKGIPYTRAALKKSCNKRWVCRLMQLLEHGLHGKGCSSNFARKANFKKHTPLRHNKLISLVRKPQFYEPLSKEYRDCNREGDNEHERN